MRLRRTVQPSIQELHLPAPVGGLNAISAGTAMPASDCFQLYNMIPAEYGLRTRLGSRQWCTGLTGNSDNYVRSILPFTGSAGAGTNNKLFATTSSGIWDVTSSGGVVSGAWATSTAYAVGTFVTASSTTYVCKTAGTSSGTASSMPSVWAATTAYALNARVVNDSNVYICATAGTSAGSGGPTGTSAGITDGTAVWNYQSASSAVSDGTAVWYHKPNNVAPTQVFAFSSSSGRAGHGVCHVHVTSAGHFLLYWDEVNGLHVYTESSNTWSATFAGATAITGVTPANLVHGTVFKGRVWHVERDTAKLWYMGTGAIYGAATEFGLSLRFKAGGPVRGLWNWTGVNGAGLDDKLVVASDGGDIVVWEGTDPSSANTFGMSGVWQVGALPAGREVATDIGGELLLLTRMGLLPMSQLGQSFDTSAYVTAKIANLFNQAMLSKASTHGWSMRLHPEDNSLVITVPEAEGSNTTQIVMSLAGKAWSRYRDLDVYCTGSFGGKLYFGDVSGNVWINDGNVDDVTLADPNAYTDIQYAGLSAFQNLGSSRQKQIQLIIPTFLGQSTSPSFEVAARYDFDASELATVSAGAGVSGGWDSGLWDAAIWGGEYSASRKVRGAAGMGVAAAIAWRGASRDRTILTGFDIGFTQGGML